MDTRRGPLSVVAAAVLWGTAGTAGTLAQAGPVSLAAARLVLGGAVLAVAAVAVRRRNAQAERSSARPRRTGRGGDRPAAVRAFPRPPGVSGVRGARQGLRELLLGAVAVAAYQLCFFAAVARTGVAVATVVAIGSGPVFTGILSWAMERTVPARRWAAGTAAAIIGCAVLITGGGAGGADAGGVAFALLGGLLYAFYAVTASRAIGRGMESAAVMGVLFGGAAVIMLPILLTTGPAWLARPQGLLTAGYLGCATTALAYLLYGRGLRTTPVATAATLALAEPAVAALLGVAVLRERLSAVSWAGLVLLALSLVVVALPQDAKRAETTASPRSSLPSAPLPPPR